MSIEDVERLAKDLDGKIEEVGLLPDGSGFATISMALPENHWLYYEDPSGYENPPMTFRMAIDHPRYRDFVDRVTVAAKYALRAATIRGTETDFSPDAFLQNLIVGLTGYHTVDGLSPHGRWNPSPIPPLMDETLRPIVQTYPGQTNDESPEAAMLPDNTKHADQEPQPPTFVSLSESVYNGRRFYGDGTGCNGHSDMRAQLTYLRDWQRWAQGLPARQPNFYQQHSAWSNKPSIEPKVGQVVPEGCHSDEFVVMFLGWMCAELRLPDRLKEPLGIGRAPYRDTRAAVHHLAALSLVRRPRSNVSRRGTRDERCAVVERRQQSGAERYAMKVLVCGGRGYANYDAVVFTLSRLPIARIIHGGARGADTLAGRYAREAGIPCDVFNADWDRFGRAAGHIRNSRMLEEGKPDLVVAFPGGRGTADMVRRATSGGVNVHRVYEGEG